MTEIVKDGVDLAYEQARIARTPTSTMDLLFELAKRTNDPQVAVAAAKAIVELEQNARRFQWEAQDREAKVGFATAFADFKANLPRIVKTAEISVNGQVRGRYAPLDRVCDALIPALIHVGITHRWKSVPTEGGGLQVTCYLKHVLGYEEEGSVMAAPPDTSGSKNAIQAQGSTMSYLQRYTLLASCGIAVQGQDSDGIAPEDIMDESVATDFLSAIEGSGSVDELRSNFRRAMRACGVPDAVMDNQGDVIGSAKDKRAARAFADARQKMVRKFKGGSHA